MKQARVAPRSALAAFAVAATAVVGLTLPAGAHAAADPSASPAGSQRIILRLSGAGGP
jgi:hypothetical protein